MERKERKILLYQERNFTAKFDDTFAYLRQNWRVLLKYITYLLLPVSLVQGLAYNGYLEGSMSMAKVGASDVDAVLSLALSMGGVVVTSIVGALLLWSVVYALYHLYLQREDGIAGITGEELRPRLLFCLKRMGLSMLFFIVVGAVVIAVMAGLMVLISPWLAGPLVIALLVVSIPLALFSPVYLLEDDITLIEALQKSLRLGFAHWWGTLAIGLVMGLIVSFAQGLFTTPYYIAIIVKAFLGVQQSSDTMTDSAGYSFLLYLLSVVQSFATYVLSTMVAMSLAMQYGHAAEKEDQVSMQDNIDRFEQL